MGILHLSQYELEVFGITTVEMIYFFGTLIDWVRERKAFSTSKSVMQTLDGHYIISTPAVLGDPTWVNSKAVQEGLALLISGAFESRSVPSDRTGSIFRGHALRGLAFAALTYQKFAQRNLLS